MASKTLFSLNIPALKLGSSGIYYLGGGKFNITVPLTDGKTITMYNPQKNCGCKKSYPLCSFSQIEEDGCYVMSNNANEKEYKFNGKRGRIDPSVATMALVIKQIRLYADFLKNGNISQKKYKYMEASEIFKEIFDEPENHKYVWERAIRILDKDKEENCEYVPKMIWQAIGEDNFMVKKESASAFEKMFSV